MRPSVGYDLSYKLYPPRTADGISKQDSQEPPMKKLAIHAPNENELYTTETELRCFACSDSDCGQPVEDVEAKVGLSFQSNDC